MYSERAFLRAAHDGVEGDEGCETLIAGSVSYARAIYAASNYVGVPLTGRVRMGGSESEDLFVRPSFPRCGFGDVL